MQDEPIYLIQYRQQIQMFGHVQTYTPLSLFALSLLAAAHGQTIQTRFVYRIHPLQSREYIKVIDGTVLRIRFSDGARLEGISVLECSGGGGCTGEQDMFDMFPARSHSDEHVGTKWMDAVNMVYDLDARERWRGVVEDGRTTNIDNHRQSPDESDAMFLTDSLLRAREQAARTRRKALRVSLATQFGEDIDNIYLRDELGGSDSTAVQEQSENLNFVAHFLLRVFDLMSEREFSRDLEPLPLANRGLPAPQPQQPYCGWLTDDEHQVSLSSVFSTGRLLHAFIKDLGSRMTYCRSSNLQHEDQVEDMDARETTGRTRSKYSVRNVIVVSASAVLHSSLLLAQTDGSLDAGTIRNLLQHESPLFSLDFHLRDNPMALVLSDPEIRAVHDLVLNNKVCRTGLSTIGINSHSAKDDVAFGSTSTSERTTDSNLQQTFEKLFAAELSVISRTLQEEYNTMLRVWCDLDLIAVPPEAAANLIVDRVWQSASLSESASDEQRSFFESAQGSNDHVRKDKDMAPIISYFALNTDPDLPWACEIYAALMQNPNFRPVVATIGILHAVPLPYEFWTTYSGGDDARKPRSSMKTAEDTNCEMGEGIAAPRQTSKSYTNARNNRTYTTEESWTLNYPRPAFLPFGYTGGDYVPANDEVQLLKSMASSMQGCSFGFVLNRIFKNDLYRLLLYSGPTGTFLRSDVLCQLNASKGRAARGVPEDSISGAPEWYHSPIQRFHSPRDKLDEVRCYLDSGIRSDGVLFPIVYIREWVLLGSGGEDGKDNGNVGFERLARNVSRVSDYIRIRGRTIWGTNDAVLETIWHQTEWRLRSGGDVLGGHTATS
mmetsp:Transcript_70459/g.199830  ORF Transcript_70459/g.199830 Transcript_70459/m.199830 type:complete len:832 (+) Transcript_70459:104-2599(+)|eukprot:CAMPEP_0168358502 /NCGR_PEP_ID=MMETSP0228-20121227/1148_1 /TAXON_ID=133427 /ORGANISM="Protoceratium reticulatum, Strain CCCM 535 (=CCMP 1889)" /LENGTH=831 /DNA_ID=CAMNT_0008371079 /DNA_START=97 /DNA_END=2592 /DNA_ORIENTATION=-